MVMDRPTRGVALGGASAGVGAVCQTVADHLAASRGLLPSVWLERGGRLRGVARPGPWPGPHRTPTTSGCVGPTFTSGVETVVPDATAGAAGSAGIVAEACVPIRSEG